jgi:nucleotide-binding universal stress UspA family protein
METFSVKRILIPVDFSETALLALDHATFMAKLFKAEIILIHVVEKFSFKIDIRKKNDDAADDREIRARLSELADGVKHQTGGTVQILMKAGKIAKKIVEAANETQADIIILGTHGVSGFEEFFMGSNAFRVVTEAQCPVMSVQVHSTKVGFNHIVLPIDNSAASRQKVRYAVELAKHYNSTIHIAGIITLDYKDIRKKFMAKLKQVEDYISKHGISHTTEILKGENIATLTLKHAEKLNADLIVIMTEQEDELTGLLMGTFAQQVVNHSKIPVMTVKPSLKLDVELNVFSGV